MSLWARREQPILDAIATLSSTSNSRFEDIEKATGMTHQEVQTGVWNLYEAAYITGMDVSSMGDGFDLIEIRLLERGLRATGMWPSDPYDEFVRVLHEAIANEPDAEKKSRLERVLDAVTEVGKGVATGVITEIVKRAAGIP
jgi:hypothetical protein